MVSFYRNVNIISKYTRYRLSLYAATMKAGVPFAAKFFPPMYILASRLQIALAVGGTLASVMQWYLLRDSLWAIGAALLVFVFGKVVQYEFGFRAFGQFPIILIEIDRHDASGRQVTGHAG